MIRDLTNGGIFLVLSLVAKIVCQLPVQVYALGIGCLLISFVYVIADKAKNGILWIKEKDDVLTTINNKVLARAYMIEFWMLGLIESGKYNPSINMCIEICKALNKTLDELFWPEE